MPLSPKMVFALSERVNVFLRLSLFTQSDDYGKP
jgi:hypothetical protein